MVEEGPGRAEVVHDVVAFAFVELAAELLSRVVAYLVPC